MNFFLKRPYLAALAIVLIRGPVVAMADPATDMATAIRAKQEGSQYIRARMEAGGTTFQLQIKSRVAGATADIVYQVLFPKERKGESVLLNRAGEKFGGTLFTPPNTTGSIASDQLSKSLFGSALSYEDIIDSPFTWSRQAVVGTDNINGTACQILESKPGKGHSSSYSRVRTWVDPRRMVPLRIEKYDASGKVKRRIETTRVMLDGSDSIPADLRIQGPGGSMTDIDGSRIKRQMTYADSDFTADGLKQLTVPPGAAP
jgi:hypothetical protein